MHNSAHFGLIGGLGVGATVHYYRAIAAACSARELLPRMTIAHADAPTALALVGEGRIDGLADYLAGFVDELAKGGATFAAIPAITPHICRGELKARSSLPLVDMLDVTAQLVTGRELTRVALFGTKFTIDSQLFGVLDGVEVVQPSAAEIAETHRIYMELAINGRCSESDEEKLREIAATLVQRDGVEAIILAGTDLNLIFDETRAGFPAVDCAAAHIEAIVDRMAE